MLADSFLGAPLAVKHIGASDVVPLCTSSIWKVPPLGRERSSARTTVWDSVSTDSRMLADAALCVPRTARKAFSKATVIFCGSKGTTEPLRRMI